MTMHLRSKISPIPLSLTALLWSASHENFDELRKYDVKQDEGVGVYKYFDLLWYEQLLSIVVDGWGRKLNGDDIGINCVQ